MKYFKTEASRISPRHIITPESFQMNTENKYPFVQTLSNGKLSAYGICPCCLNPIQLIGIFNEIKVAPYGKHNGKPVKDMPEWNYAKYQYCPYYTDAYKQPNDKEQLLEIDNSVIELYNLLKSQFDRAVYIIEKEFHIYCSNPFWEKALKKYVVSGFYRYPWLTEANLPYIFAYFGMQQCNCYSQGFEVGSNLYKALEAYPNVKFMEIEGKPYFRRLSNSGSGGFFKLVFRFTSHCQESGDGKVLKESVKFCVDDNCNGTTVYEDIIKFDETYFMNLVNKHGNENNRRQRLLDVAEKCMPPLLINS